MKKNVAHLEKQAIKYQTQASKTYHLSQIYKKVGNAVGYKVYSQQSFYYHKKSLQYLSILINH